MSRECKHCGKAIVRYTRDGNWDMIGDDDPWMHISPHGPHKAEPADEDNRQRLSMSNLHSWANTVLLTIVVCIAVWVSYPKNVLTTSTTTTTVYSTTSTTIEFNVPMSEAHEYEQENE